MAEKVRQILPCSILQVYDLINDFVTIKPMIAAVPNDPVSISEASSESACCTRSVSSIRPKLIRYIIFAYEENELVDVVNRPL